MQNEVQKFIDAVHRRLVFTRLVEQIGRGMFAGSVLAVAVVGLAILQSVPTGPVLILCLALGTVVGFGLAMANWPRRLTTAAEADRQLGLDDLLTTVLLCNNTPDEDFTRATLAMAVARCRLHSPSDVLLRRLGARSWGGIALALSVAATLAVIPVGASRSSARDNDVSVLSDGSAAALARRPPVELAAVLSRNNDPMSESPSIVPASDGLLADHHAAENAPAAEYAKDSAGGTGGTSTTTDRTLAKPDEIAMAQHRQEADGTPSGRGGTSAAVRDQRGETIGGTAAGSSIPVPRWTSDGASPPAKPLASVSEDRVPAEDRDLVRDFFHH